MKRIPSNLSSSLQHILRFIIGLPLTIITFIFIGRLIFHAIPDIQSRIIHINLVTLVIGFIFLIGFFIMKAWVWNAILKKMGIEIPIEKSLYFYSYSELRRYIPGNIFSFVSRVNILKRYNVPIKTSVQAMAVESCILVISAGIISIPSVTFFRNFFQMEYNIYNQFGVIPQLITLGIFLVLCISFIAIYFYRKFTLRFQLSLFFPLQYSDVVLFSCVGWILYGIGNYFIASSIKYIDPILFFQFAALFVFAWLVGYLAFVFPMGLGIREGIVTNSLAAYTDIPIQLTAFISIFCRIILIAAELTTQGIFYFCTKYVHILRKFTRIISIQTGLLWFLMASYISYFSYITFEKYNNFFSGRFDLGNMDQTVWNTIHGRIFVLTNPDSTNIVSRLGTHADFILILISPLYLLWEDPRMLLLIQTVCIGFGALFVYLLAQKVLNNKTVSLLFGISYLLNPWIQKQNLYDFHGVSLATTFLLALFYFLAIKKHLFFLIFLILSVLTKENIFLIAALIGLYLMIKRQFKFGLVISVISGILFYVLVAKLIPSARGGPHFALSYLTDFGDSPSAVIKSMLFNPMHTFSKIVTLTNLNYVFQLLLPAGFLSLLSPFYLIFTAPELLINLLSSNTNLRSIDFHYGAAIVPFVYISAIYGANTLLKQKYIQVKSTYFLYYFTVAIVFTTWMYGVLPGTRNPALEVFTHTLPDRNLIAHFIKTIPSKYSVAATNNVGAHLSHRERIYTIPNGIDQADIILFLLNDQFAQPSLVEQERMVNRLSHDPTYTNVFEDDPFIVFTKKRVHNLDVNF